MSIDPASQRCLSISELLDAIVADIIAEDEPYQGYVPHDIVATTLSNCRFVCKNWGAWFAPHVLHTIGLFKIAGESPNLAILISNLEASGRVAQNMRTLVIKKYDPIDIVDLKIIMAGFFQFWAQDPDHNKTRRLINIHFDVPFESPAQSGPSLSHEASPATPLDLPHIAKLIVNIRLDTFNGTALADVLNLFGEAQTLCLHHQRWFDNTASAGQLQSCATTSQGSHSQDLHGLSQLHFKAGSLILRPPMPVDKNHEQNHYAMRSLCEMATACADLSAFVDLQNLSIQDYFGLVPDNTGRVNTAVVQHVNCLLEKCAPSIQTFTLTYSNCLLPSLQDLNHWGEKLGFDFRPCTRLKTAHLMLWFDCRLQHWVRTNTMEAEAKVGVHDKLNTSRADLNKNIWASTVTDVLLSAPGNTLTQVCLGFSFLIDLNVKNEINESAAVERAISPLFNPGPRSLEFSLLKQAFAHHALDELEIQIPSIIPLSFCKATQARLHSEQGLSLIRVKRSVQLRCEYCDEDLYPQY